MRLLCVIGLGLFLTGCASAPEGRQSSASSRSQRAQREAVKARDAARARDTARAEASVPPQPMRSPTNLATLDAVVSSYQTVIASLAKPDNGASDEQVAALKANLERILQTGGKLSLLTNLEDGSGWFGDAMVATTQEGQAYVIDKKGKHFTAQLKDRVIGGVYDDGGGKKRLLTIFYAPISDASFCTAYVGTEKANVVAFDLDRQNGSGLTAKLRTPAGKLLVVSRPGRDNTKTTVNGHPLKPLFQ